MVHVLDVVSPSFPVSVVVATVYLERGAKVVGGLMYGGGGEGIGERNGVSLNVFRGLGFHLIEKKDEVDLFTLEPQTHIRVRLEGIVGARHDRLWSHMRGHELHHCGTDCCNSQACY